MASRAPPPRGRGWGGERDTGQPGEVRLRAAWGSASSADPSSLAMDGERPGVGRCEASRPTSGAPAGPNPSSRSILSWRPEEREDGKQRWSSGGVVCWVVYSCVDSWDGPCVVSRGGVFFSFSFSFFLFSFGNSSLSLSFFKEKLKNKIQKYTSPHTHYIYIYS